MKNKKIIIIFLILFIILIIGGYFLINYLKKVNVKDQTIVEEYTPEEEISEDQLRQTIVSLYFPNKETKESLAFVKKLLSSFSFTPVNTSPVLCTSIFPITIGSFISIFNTSGVSVTSKTIGCDK